MTATLRIAQPAQRSRCAPKPVIKADGTDVAVAQREKEDVVQRPRTQQGGRKEEEIRPGGSTDCGTRPRGRLHDANGCRLTGTAYPMRRAALRSIDLIVQVVWLETGCVSRPAELRFVQDLSMSNFIQAS
jgi:hypothetical protein